MPLKQESRLVAIKTALGPDVLALRSVSVQEQLSRLFQIEVELSSEDGEIDFDKVVGRDATIRLNVGQEDKRYFSGVVSRLVQVANQGGYAHYRATIVPWLWFLTRTSDCRIFQEKSVSDIIEEVFKGHGFSDYKLKLSGSYEKKEYCVQYRETDFNFVSRLMEEEGIYYFFEHEDGKHTLVLADSISANKPFPGYAEVTFHELDSGGAAEREVITDWIVEKEVQPVAYALNDFDFQKPKTPLIVRSNVTRKYGKAEFEIFDYPGEYLEHGEGERLADVRLNELQTQHEVLHGQASARGLATGYTFKLKNHPRADQNREYLITSVTLQVDAGEFGSTGGAGADGFFSCSFSAVEKAQQFRPARLTPKPIVQGPQTAIVVGPAGEEIHTDAHGRVKVHFHWDRHDESNENSSCWIRVSQANAGKGWGSMITPRIGQEVIVDFLEGDPDRPIITGRVYNADQKPPYAGGQGVVSGLKSNTHKGSGNNEMSLDDTAGKENFKTNAQFDMNSAVGNNQNNTVAVDQTNKVGSNQKEDIGAKREVSIGASDKVSVGGNRELSIGGSSKTSVTGKEETTIGGSSTTSVTGKEETTIGGKSSLTVGGKRSETIAGSHTIMNPKMMITSATSHTIAAGSKLTQTSPKVNLLAGSKFLANSGGTMDVKSSAKMTQQSGAAMSVKSGAALKMQSSAAMSMKSGAAMKSDASGGMSMSSGGALTQKGSVIKLNSPTKIKGTTLTVE